LTDRIEEESEKRTNMKLKKRNRKQLSSIYDRYIVQSFKLIPEKLIDLFSKNGLLQW